MSAAPKLLAEIEDPLSTPGWRVSRPDDEGALHAEVLRELCHHALPLHVGGAGARGLSATLQLVDVLQEQLVLASHDDGITVARALQARPLWAAALLHGMRVQFALAATSATREDRGSPGSSGPPSSSRGERFWLLTRWPRDIYRTSRRSEARLPAGRHPRSQQHAPVVRLTHGNLLVSTRNLRVLDLSEHGCALVLPAGMVPPAAGTVLRQVELELDEEHMVTANASVQHVSVAGRSAHRIGCRWEDLSGGARLMLRRWLADASRPLPVGEASEVVD